jgi:hypothetical protein
MLDKTNASIEIVCAFLVWSNVLKIRRDKEVKGVDWRTSAFYACVGLWYVNYYAQMKQPFSLIAQMVFVLGSWTWVAHAIYYSRRAR